MLGSIPPITVVIVLLVVVGMAGVLVELVRLKRKLSTFMTGKDGASLEATLDWITKKIASTDETLDAHKEALEFLDRRVKRSVRGYSLVRYNAYESDGGDQSFASALLDEHNDGYILSVITNRNHVGVYAKRINRGTPESVLTEQETDALTIAQKSLK